MCKHHIEEMVKVSNTMNINDRSCTCNQWPIFSISCSHIFVVCHHRGWDPTTFIMDIYSKINYKLAYEADLYPFANRILWNEASFHLEHYKSNTKGNQSNRPRTRRYHSSMDARNIYLPSRCGNYYKARHNRRTCANHNCEE